RSTVAPAPAQPLPSAAEVALREQTADQQIRQALNRLTFGPRPGDFERVRAMGVDRWIAMQLDPARIDDHAADALMAHFPTLSMSAADLVREAPPPAAIIAQKRLAQRRAGTGAPSNGRLVLTTEDSMQIRRARQMAQRIVGELQAAKVARAVVSERQLQEVMVDFWENHFNVFAGKGPERYFLGAYDRETIRPYALGKFRDLLEAVAKSPAMLYYLDNWESTVEPDRPALAGRPTARGRYALARARTRRRFGAAPVGAARLDSAIQASRRTRGLNENYGRELLELHTLGVDGGYTQQDVIAAARAFTGWTIARPREGGSFVFRPAMHDAGVKVFLGDTLKPGRGIEDGEQVLDIVARSPATAHFIATKLVRRFVSDSPPPALVKRAAATFSRTDGDIREVLRTIFTSPEFFSTAAYKAKVKSPFELVVSALRAVNAEPDTTPRTARVVAWLGQPLFAHRDPNGYPETGDAWINTGAILNRINFGLAFAAGRLPGVSLPRWQHQIGLDTLPPDQQVDGVIRAVLGGEASPDTRKVLESGENPLLASLP
ncbi:MAG: DUF1800 domain-containing protein, partial [Gemmatimonadaceae bacterium]|nr:DUF1800 domain-containing protein [Gemmatimonadaceae bacterium]